MFDRMYSRNQIDELCTLFPAYSRDKIERIIQSAKQHGSNRRAIARETGFDVNLVLKVIKKAGIRTLHHHYHVDEQLLRRLHKEGSTDHQIAQHLGAPGSAITSKRQRLRLPVNHSSRWPELLIGQKQENGFLEISSGRDKHSRYAVICHCRTEPAPHPAGKRVYVGHFNAGSVKSCGRDIASLWADSAYAKNRRAAALKSKARRDEIMNGLSFQTCIILRLYELKLLGCFRMNDRTLLSGKEIDLVFPRVGPPSVLVEINEFNHDCTAARQRDCQKRDLAMYKFPDTEWITISQRSFLENPQAEIGKLLHALKHRHLLNSDITDIKK